MGKRKRLNSFVGSSTGVFVGCNGMFTYFGPEDRFHAQYTKNIHVYEEEEVDNTQHNPGVVIFDWLKHKYPSKNTYQIAKRYQAISNYFNNLIDTKIKSRIINTA